MLNIVDLENRTIYKEEEEDQEMTSSEAKILSFEEVSKHNQKSDCWLIISGKTAMGYDGKIAVIWWCTLGGSCEARRKRDYGELGMSI
ncbi:hypothetical protein OSB04_031926 [Centaurea solstitialis]|uniref:Uncharacterized protein n=1 Tax=Centaurea solstitialis TaxID=347529 RepID=A0AA38SHZ1_9ASTR|nr:hypothetical protein OSB04_031926 [Centaurea solstitialis]